MIFDAEADCFFIDKQALLCHTLSAGKKILSPPQSNAALYWRSVLEMRKTPAEDCIQYPDILCLVYAVVLKTMTCSGDNLIIEPPAAG